MTLFYYKKPTGRANLKLKYEKTGVMIYYLATELQTRVEQLYYLTHV